MDFSYKIYLYSYVFLCLSSTISPHCICSPEPEQKTILLRLRSLKRCYELVGPFKSILLEQFERTIIGNMEKLLSWTKIVSYARKFSSEGDFGNNTERGRPSVSEKKVQTPSTCFHVDFNRPMRRAVTELSTFYCTIQTYWKMQIHMFLYKIGTFHGNHHHDYTQ